MSQNKKVGIIVSISLVAVLAIGSGALLFVNSHKSNSTLSTQELADNAASRVNEQGDGTTGPVSQLSPNQSASPAPAAGSSVPAASSQKATTTTPGLGVTSSSNSASLGQLNSSNQSATGTSTDASSSSSGSSARANSNPFDPTTFAQYDTYKSETSAEFGDVQVGTGATLASGQTAQVYYRGWLTNGTLFDQSRSDSSGKLQPFSFTVGSHQVITGWEEGLVGMRVGGVRLLIVPPAVGYGDTAQSSIPANSVLVFQVQLVAVQ